MFIHCSAGSLSGMTVVGKSLYSRFPPFIGALLVLTNSLDVLRANIQVRRIKSIVLAAKMLWSEERYNLFVKGLSARIVHSAFSSTFIAAGKCLFVIND